MDNLICHFCNTGNLIQFGATSDVDKRKWFFLCENKCPVKYTIIEEPCPKDQVEIMFK